MCPCEFRPATVAAETVNSVGQLARVTATGEFELIYEATQFEQRRALVARELKRRGQGIATFRRVRECASPHPHQLGVVEVHSRFFGMAQRHVQSLPRHLWLTRGNQQAADCRVVKSEEHVEIGRAHV